MIDTNRQAIEEINEQVGFISDRKTSIGVGTTFTVSSGYQGSIPNALLCNGGSYYTASYPELFNKIGFRNGISGEFSTQKWATTYPSMNRCVDPVTGYSYQVATANSGTSRPIVVTSYDPNGNLINTTTLATPSQSGETYISIQNIYAGNGVVGTGYISRYGNDSYTRYGFISYDNGNSFTSIGNYQVQSANRDGAIFCKVSPGYNYGTYQFSPILYLKDGSTYSIPIIDANTQSPTFISSNSSNIYFFISNVTGIRALRKTGNKNYAITDYKNIIPSSYPQLYSVVILVSNGKEILMLNTFNKLQYLNNSGGLSDYLPLTYSTSPSYGGSSPYQHATLNSIVSLSDGTIFMRLEGNEVYNYFVSPEGNASTSNFAGLNADGRQGVYLSSDRIITTTGITKNFQFTLPNIEHSGEIHYIRTK